MKTFWDQRYDTPAYIYGKDANGFFAETLGEINPGLVLLPAEGEGRNAVFAAGLGWKVHAFDNSSVARNKALNLAAEKKINILYALTNIQDFDPGQFKYDAIGLVYTHFPIEIRHNFFRQIQNCLSPGGKIILEGFHKKQIHLSTGGPKDLSMLFSIEELQNDFDQLHIEQLTAETIDLDEGGGHIGTAEIVRLIATTPAP